ncbi:MAG: hypothetical protein NTV52_16285 [Acidobacteria bacterium]|nr:hypothetical protein [Acidobacteriota bacterium]
MVGCSTWNGVGGGRWLAVRHFLGISALGGGGSSISEVGDAFWAVETHLKYSGYSRQEERQVARLQASEARSIPVE